MVVKQKIRNYHKELCINLRIKLQDTRRDDKRQSRFSSDKCNAECVLRLRGRFERSISPGPAKHAIILRLKPRVPP